MAIIAINRRRRFEGKLGRILAALLFLSLIHPYQAVARNSVERELEKVFQRRQHVRYSFGGCDDSQMDCSCFVQKAFSEAFHTDIPRSTLGQARFFERDLLARLRSTKHLAPATMCPGDLIYTYKGNDWQHGSRHVAIYAGKGQVLHAARGVGVAMQSLKVLTHHRLKGVVRLFECRGSGAGINAGVARPDAPSPSTRPTKNAEKVLRNAVHEFFVAWQRSELSTYDSFWSPGALQWLKKPGVEADVMADRLRTFDQLKGQVWRYWVHRLQVRERSAFVELASELPCDAAHTVGCGRQTQTFIWRLDDGDQWRIAQHEIGSAE